MRNEDTKQEGTPMFNLDIYQQILATNPRFGSAILPPVNLLEFAMDLQIRTNRVVARQLGLQVKNYAEYDKDEIERNKYTHLAHVMRVCQSLSRLCSALNTPLQAGENYRTAHFGQKKYS